MQIPLKAIHYFEAVSRLGSYSEAARELFVTHAAVIAQVRKLEQWLDCRLFHSDGGKLSLTQEGSKFSERIRPGLQIIEQAVLDLKDVHKRGQLIVSIIPSLANHFLLPALQDFYENHPEIDLQLNYHSPGKDVNSHFILSYSNEGELAGEYFRLFSGMTLPICGAEYFSLNFKEKPHKTNDFSQFTLLHDYDRLAWQAWFSKYGKPQTSLAFDKGNVFSDFNLMHTAVLKNHGVALCPPVLISDEIRQGYLKILSFQPGNTNRFYYLSVNKPCSSEIKDTFLNWVLGLAQKMEHNAAEYLIPDPKK